jgi:dihydropteroate synthase
VTPSQPDYAPVLLGVINLSPESMVKDSIVTGPDAALERARQLQEHGVSILDIGGRSITPDAPEIDDASEQERLEHVVRRLTAGGFRISVDTWSPATAARALDWGATLVNYTRRELPDALLERIAAAGATLALSYMPYGDAYRMRKAERDPRPTSPTDPTRPTGRTDPKDRMDAIVELLAPGVERARAAGVPEILVDPNLGILHPDTDDYAKAHLQLEVLASLDRLRALGCPLLLYAARKPERLARILFAECVLRARPEYVRTHEPEIIARLLAAARESAA